MAHSKRWLTAVALIGTVASVAAAGILWLVLTRPEVVAATMGAWLGVRR